MDLQTYLQQRPDLLQNWKNANDPAFLAAHPDDPNVGSIRQFGSLENYASASNGGQKFDAATGTPSTGGGLAGLVGTAGGGTAGAGGGATGSSGFNVQSYLAAHPDIANNYNSDPDAYNKQFGSLEGYVSADARVNGSPDEKLSVASFKPPIATGYTPTTTSGGPDGGNFHQNQSGSQVGAFDTKGQTNVDQTKGTLENTVQAQVGNKTGTNANTTNQTSTQQGTTGQSTTNNEVANTTQNQDATTRTQGTNVTNAVDSLGFGQLLKDSAGAASANDATRNTFLTDVVNTGGSQLGSQVDQAMRQSGSGATLVGAGDSANARARGYAAAQIGRNNLDQRLGAAQQLAGPTSLSTLSTSANPYIGKSESVDQTARTQGTTTGTTNTSGTSNSLGFQNLIGTNNSTSKGVTSENSSLASNSSTTGLEKLLGQTNESSSGQANGQSSQAASGQIPESKQVSSGGGCVLCTAATELGLYNAPRVLRTVIAYKLRTRRFGPASRGYFFLFTPLAAWLLRHPRVASVLYPLAKMVVYEELRVSGRQLPVRKGAWVVHWTGHFICATLGTILPLPREVRNARIEAIARKNNIWFNLNKETF